MIALVAVVALVAGCGRLGFDALAPGECDVSTPGCPPDVVPFEIGGRRYVWLTMPRSAPDASDACERLGMRLARIDDTAEHDALWARVAPEVAWLAGTDIEVEGEWRWPDDGTQFWAGLHDGSPIEGVYQNWESGEPNNTGDSEDCLVLWPPHDGLWADETCSDEYSAVCEAP